MAFVTSRPYPIPYDDEARLAALSSYELVDTPPEAEFDHIVHLASQIFKVPIALVSLVERDRQLFKARVGLDACETSREVSFCAHAIMDDQVFVVLDAARDTRFADNPLVRDAPFIRFYAGAPLIGAEGHKLGSLCLIDQAPRANFSETEGRLLADLAALAVDRMEMRRQQSMRRASEQRFEKMTATTPSAVICADSRGCITAWVGSAATMFGYEPDEALGRSLDIIVPERLREAPHVWFERDAAEGPAKVAAKTVELVGLHRNGDEFPIELSLSRWPEADGLAFGAIITDISGRRRREERLQHLAHFDQLTGLPNRTQFLERTKTAVAAGRSTILLLDLDRFKDVNNSLGHAVGDELLIRVARALVEHLGPETLVARLGGDEFGVLLPGCACPIQASAVASEILDAIAATFVVKGHFLRIGASIGLAQGSSDVTSEGDLIANADLALYRAKAEGGGGYQFFLPALRSAVEARQSVELELHRALAQSEFELHYQPQVRLRDGALVGAEALLRWRHPERGLLAPAAFLGVVETTPLAAPVGQWVIDTACAQAATWKQRGLPGIRMGVNLFAAQFRAGDLVLSVCRALSETGLPAKDLELEITETTILKTEEAMIGPLQQLRELGVGIAFDDYGTGYASLSLLKRYPLTRLKIDRSFIRDLVSDEDDSAIVRTVLTLGRSLGLDVIAEGIEEPEQEAILKSQGCAEGQGYLYGKPMTSACFFELATTRKLAA